MGVHDVMEMIAIGVGSNLGDRAAQIASAVQMLAETEGVSLQADSSLIETAPVGGVAQGPYLNGAVVIHSTLSPEAVLERLHAIERAHGRVRPDPVRWGPRTMDLDLLLYGEHVSQEGAPCVPHPRMHERLFVLEPLAEIAPEMRHPLLCRWIRELLEAGRAASLECS